MNEKTKLQVRISKDVKQRFDLLCSQEKINQAEMFTKLMEAYQTNVRDVKSSLDHIFTHQKELLEYVALLVKSSQDLPNKKEDMDKYVSTDSRFKPLIKEKIHGKKKDVSN